jgi:hypothetical protein
MHPSTRGDGTSLLAPVAAVIAFMNRFQLRTSRNLNQKTAIPRLNEFDQPPAGSGAARK